jgi:hypothetical protein
LLTAGDKEQKDTDEVYLPQAKGKMEPQAKRKMEMSMRMAYLKQRGGWKCQ